ncbi:MAG: hypothetical protein ABIR96_00400 [Bdellovibrionota bacterium]
MMNKKLMTLSFVVIAMTGFGSQRVHAASDKASLGSLDCKAEKNNKNQWRIRGGLKVISPRFELTNDFEKLNLEKGSTKANGRIASAYRFTSKAKAMRTCDRVSKALAGSQIKFQYIEDQANYYVDGGDTYVREFTYLFKMDVPGATVKSGIVKTVYRDKIAVRNYLTCESYRNSDNSWTPERCYSDIAKEIVSYGDDIALD